MNVSKLARIMKPAGFNKVRSDAIDNATRIVIHFYSKGEGDSATLRKLTKLSKYGLAKYIRSLKKRGLIQRTRWQQFSPTVYAVSLMQKAGCGV